MAHTKYLDGFLILLYGSVTSWGVPKGYKGIYTPPPEKNVKKWT